MAFPLAQILHHSAHVSRLTEIKEGSDLTHALGSNRRSCFPFEIEVTLLEAFYNFELVADDPVLLRVLLEVEREITAHHSAGQLFSR